MTLRPWDELRRQFGLREVERASVELYQQRVHVEWHQIFQDTQLNPRPGAFSLTTEERTRRQFFKRALAFAFLSAQV